eukprot:5161945-Ditylum_brightwellii.AAC.1
MWACSAYLSIFKASSSSTTVFSLGELLILWKVEAKAKKDAKSAMAIVSSASSNPTRTGYGKSA